MFLIWKFFIGASVTEIDSPRLPSHLSEYERDTLLVHPEVKYKIFNNTKYYLQDIYYLHLWAYTFDYCIFTKIMYVLCVFLYYRK